MVETFRLLDAERNVVMGERARELMKDITAYFQEVQESLSRKGAPTPENPFILGYSISQKIPTTAEKDSTATQDKTPVYFKPKQFNMSVTPGDGTAQQFITTSGTLNFCMLTQRPGLDGDKRVEIDETDFNAGVIKRNFFDITKSMGKTTDTRGFVQGHDGIMAFSKELFHNMWLRDLLGDLKFDPAQVYRPVLAKASFGDSTPEDRIHISVRPDSEEKLSNGWRSTQVWKMDAVDVNGIGIDPYDRRQFALGKFCPDPCLRAQSQK